MVLVFAAGGDPGGQAEEQAHPLFLGARLCLVGKAEFLPQQPCLTFQGIGA